MNITPEIDLQVDLIINKVQILFEGKESLIINYIKDWDISYDKTGTSLISIHFYGASQKLLKIQRDKARINYIKFVGKFDELEEERNENFLLNIPCDMIISDFDISKNGDDELTEMTVVFSGDMW